MHILTRFLLITISCIGLAVGSPPIKTPGFTFQSGQGNAPVQLQVFIDLLCPYSRASYEGIKSLGEKYHGKDLRIRFQFFPLPFHKQSFTVSQSAVTIAHTLGDSSFQIWMETIYSNQELFYNKPTKDLTSVEVVLKLKHLALKTFLSLSEKAWDEGMTGYGGTEMDDQTRVMYRYSLAHGITGTPMFYLNGLHFSEADSSWKFGDWDRVIKPLIDGNRVEVSVNLNSPEANPINLSKRVLPDRNVYSVPHSTNKMGATTACDEYGSRPCEFLSNLYMCCNDNEACILGQGCNTL